MSTEKFVTYYSHDPDALLNGIELTSDRQPLTPDAKKITPPSWTVAMIYEGCGVDDSVFFIADRRSTGGSSEYALVGVAPNRERVELKAGPRGENGRTRAIEVSWRKEGAVTIPGTVAQAEAKAANDHFAPKTPRIPRPQGTLDLAM